MGSGSKMILDGVSVGSPLLSPIAQSTSEISRRVSIKQLQDRLLVVMPGVDNPDSYNMTMEQMRRYQDGMARAYKNDDGGSTAMVDPDTLPSPSLTPEEPSTHPSKLKKLKREEVGSGLARKPDSSNTIIVNAHDQAISVNDPEEKIKQRQRVRIVTSSNTPKGSSFEIQIEHGNNMNKNNSSRATFLGQWPYNQTVSGTQSLSPRKADHIGSLGGSDPSPALVDPPPPSPILSQYLPTCTFYIPGT